MAVVQISKIQIRRGLKNTSSGVPQLSSAEMAWTVDTQELYIGNGSVAEGAPYVGNTKILTEHDNILDLASGYRFANTDTSIVDSTSRSLQSKLDEYVSVKDFGAVGDGVSDSTAAFQKALDDLFRNAEETYKKVLLIPNGEYVLNSELRIPSTAEIMGETVNGSRLLINNDSLRLVSSNGSEFENFNSTNRAELIKISNLTFVRNTGTLVISGLRNGTFDNVTFKGNYDLGDAVTSLSAEPPAIFWANPSAGVAVDDVTFVNCRFENNSISLKCIQTASFKTKIKFDSCSFFVNHVGIYVEGVSGQSNDWHIANSKFEQISQEAFYSTNGRDTLFESSSFIDCGNGTGSAQYPISPIVYFGEKFNNRVINCRNNRQQLANLVDTENAGTIVEIENADKAVFIDRVYSHIYLSDSFRPLAIFSAKSKYIIINYFLQLGNTENFRYSRIGQLTISLGDDIRGDDPGDVSITDSYQYSPNLIATTGGIVMTNFEFSIELRNNNTFDDSTAGGNADTLLLSYKNPNLTGQIGTISFDVSYGV